MTDPNEDIPPAEVRKRLLFALAAERLNGFYARGVWVDEARAAEVAAVWLSRQRIRVPVPIRKALLALSDEFARQLADSLSREAGLHLAHEMMESLDPRYQSGVALDMLAECERLLEQHGLQDEG